MRLLVFKLLSQMNVHKCNQLLPPLFFVLDRVIDPEDGACGTGDNQLFLHIDLITCEAVRFSDSVLRDIIDDAEAIQCLVGVDLVDLVIADTLREILRGG